MKEIKKTVFAASLLFVRFIIKYILKLIKNREKLKGRAPFGPQLQDRGTGVAQTRLGRGGGGR